MEEIVEVYSYDADMTFILKDVYWGDTPISREVVGFYYGEPNKLATKECMGRLKVEYIRLKTE